MKQKLIDLYDVLVNEYKVIFGDPAVILLFIIVPFMYPLLYGFMYNNETVTEVKVVTVDESNTNLSREFIRNIDAAHEVEVVARYGNLEDAQKAIKLKEAYAIIYIPSSFNKDINTEKQTTVSVYCDMSSMLFYKAVMMVTNDVAFAMGSDIRITEIGAGTQDEDETKMQPIDYEWVPFYNVANGFASFLVPAILILIVQQTMLLAIGTITGTHNDKRRFDIASCSFLGRKIGDYTLTIGKAFSYISIYVALSVWIFRIVPYMFRFPQIGDPFTLILFLFPFLLAATFFAMTITYLCSQREFPVLLIVFTSMPFLFLSGISWPWTAVPPALKALAYIVPSTPGIHGFVKINTMGATMAEVKFEYIALWVQAIFYCICAKAMYHWWIRYYKHKYNL